MSQIKEVTFDERSKLYKLVVNEGDKNVEIYANPQGEITDVAGKVDFVYLTGKDELVTQVKELISQINSNVKKGLSSERTIREVDSVGAGGSSDPIVIAMVSNTTALFNRQLSKKELQGVSILDGMSRGDKINEPVTKQLSDDEVSEAAALLTVAAAWTGDLRRAIAYRAVMNMSDETFYAGLRRLRHSALPREFLSLVAEQADAIKQGI